MSNLVNQEYLKLKDGRKLGYNEYGDKKGFPIIALHGTPGSRAWFTNDDPISKELSIRLITVDRPGYGLSDPLPGRTIIDFNKDLEQLIQNLKLRSFSIFGVSGGGAYALAFAASNPKKLEKMGLVASVYEFENGKAPKNMNRPNRYGFILAKKAPWVLNFIYNQQKKLIDSNPEAYKKANQKNMSHLCISDQIIAKTNESANSLLLHFKEAFRHNALEVSKELKLLASKWNVNFEDIIIPTEIWHGQEDTLSPVKGMKKFAELLDDYQLHILKDKGHFLDEEEAIWRKILSSLKPRK